MLLPPCSDDWNWPGLDIGPTVERTGYYRLMGTPQNEKILLAEAAEHLVISRLLLLGYPASQALRTWRADDVLVDQGPSFQVKATDKGLNWMVGPVRPNDRQFYALVDLRQRLAAVVYVLSNEDIRKVIQASYEAFRAAHPRGTRRTSVCGTC
jgi:hypothetical protein